jgi:4'-phosphopantetheinyl transferase
MIQYALEHPALTAGAVHVWQVSVSGERSRFDLYWSLLDAEERARAARFRFDRDRNQFVVARGSLRLLLGRYTGADPALIRFQQNKYGKPSLGFPDLALHHNVSHSGECIAHAFSWTAAIGVDVQSIDSLTEMAQLMSNFAEDEQRWFHSLDLQNRKRGFFELWTCKEAYIKALGLGLSKPLKDFSVSLSEGRQPRLVFDSDGSIEPDLWRFLQFWPSADIAGCLAMHGPLDRVQFLTYQGDAVLA